MKLGSRLWHVDEVAGVLVVSHFLYPRPIDTVLCLLKEVFFERLLWIPPKRAPETRMQNHHEHGNFDLSLQGILSRIPE